MKELQVARATPAAAAAAVGMGFTDDNDEPPPLELESDRRSEQGDNQREEEEEETSLMDEMVAVAQRAKDETRRRQEKERNSRTFGDGLKKGFFNAKPRAGGAAKAKTAARKAASEQNKNMPTREDLLIVKQQTKDEEEKKASSDSRFVFPEVQSALKSMNQLDPKAWMNAKFFEKLAHNPRLALALQNPRFTQAIDEMQRDPEAAIRKYRNDAAVSAMLQDFLGFLGNHFEELGKDQEAAAMQQKQQQDDSQSSSARDDDDRLDGKAALLVQQPRAQPATASHSAPTGIVDLDETRRAAIANMDRSPEEDAQVQKILQSPELLQALSDADLMARLQRCRESPQELRRLQSDPSLARKLRLLVDAGLVRFE